MPLKEMRTSTKGSDLRARSAVDEEEVSFHGDMLSLSCKWACPVNSWNYNFGIKRKLKQYKVGSPTKP